jgi:hypothetical protein
MSGLGPIEMIIIICILGFFVFVAIVILAALLMRPRTTGAGSVGTVTPDVNSLNMGDAAGGDLDGAYPAPQVVSLRGLPISSTRPTNGQVLVWNQAAGQWEPRDFPGTTSLPD